MISEAIETCWRSMPSTCMTPNVIASVIGIDARHQQRRAPLPEADQRDEHDEDDRLVEAPHEQARRSPRTCSGWSEVRATIRSGGSCGPHVGERRVDGLAEVADLLPRAHLHGERDRAGALPLAVRVAPGAGSSGTAAGSRSRA